MIQWWTPGFWPLSPLPKGTCCSFPSWLGVLLLHGLLSWVSGKGDTVSISGSRRSPGGGLGNPLQYSYLKYPMDRGSWWATVHAVTKSQTHLRDWACTHACHCTSPITALLTLNCFCELCVSLLLPTKRESNSIKIIIQSLKFPSESVKIWPLKHG